MISKTGLVVIGVIVIIVAVTGVYFVTRPEVPPTEEKFKVAILLPSPIGDYGWNYTMYTSVMRVKDALPYVEVIGVSEAVSEADVEPYLRDYSERGAKLIIAHSFGYSQACFTVAEDYPDVVFIYPGGFETRPHVATYYPRGYETTYLAGMLAGLMTETNHIGFVGAFPLPKLVWDINAYFLGAKEVNPDVENHIAFTGSWYDPGREKETADALMDVGVDFLAHHADSQAPVDAAADRERHAFGMYTDITEVGYSKSVVPTCLIIRWDDLIISTIEGVRAGTWVTGDYYLGIADGVADLSPFSPWIPENVRSIINQKRQDIIDGTFVVPRENTQWWT